jgi:membrane-associated phospholipid phosphatase
MTAGALATPRAWLWAGIYIVLAILSPLLFLVWLVKRGDVTDLDVQLRVQRSRPLLFTMACGGLAWLALVAGAAPGRMIVLAGGITLQTVLLLGITLRWKISVHTATAAGVAVLACHLLQTPLPLLGVPLIAWSRVHLKRHTTAQTIGGGLLGATIFLILLLIT